MGVTGLVPIVWAWSNRRQARCELADTGAASGGLSGFADEWMAGLADASAAGSRF